MTDWPGTTGCRRFSLWTITGCLCVFSALLAPALNAAGPPDWLLGHWVLNSERTHELQPEQSSGGGSGFGSPSISVGGVFIPLPGGAQPGAGGARDPNVLRCASMTVAMQGADVHFSYTDAGEEVMKAGNNQGRKSSWNKSKLTQKYSTTSRSVTKTYKLDSDGLLVVNVKINPQGSKSATHVRVFQRPETLSPET